MNLEAENLNEPQNPQLNIGAVMPRLTHYYKTVEEWWYRGKSYGDCGTKVGANSRRTQDKSKVTCKKCLKLLNGA